MIALRWLGRMFASFFLKPPSTPAATIVKSEVGTRTRAAHRAWGWLVLTDNDLIFERTGPMYSPLTYLKGANFVVKLADIAAMNRLPGDAFDVSPFVPILAFTLESGDAYFVQLQNVDGWLEALTSCIEANSQTADPSVP